MVLLVGKVRSKGLYPLTESWGTEKKRPMSSPASGERVSVSVENMRGLFKRRWEERRAVKGYYGLRAWKRGGRVGYRERRGEWESRLDIVMWRAGIGSLMGCRGLVKGGRVSINGRKEEVLCSRKLGEGDEVRIVVGREGWGEGKRMEEGEQRLRGEVSCRGEERRIVVYGGEE